jgi:hypothetical protein
MTACVPPMLVLGNVPSRSSDRTLIQIGMGFVLGISGAFLSSLRTRLMRWRLSRIECVVNGLDGSLCGFVQRMLEL